MPPLVYTTIASGATVSGNIDLTKTPRVIAINVPGITSGHLLVQGAFDTTSANFVRVLDTLNPGSGDLRFVTGPGSRMIMGPLVPLPPYLRLETQNAQTDVRTITLLTARW